MKSFARKLLEWYNPDKRYLPWKHTHDAYKIWLSEIILQQTRVEQGTPYYMAFIERFPTIQQLAEAPLEDVLKCWEGLGYYSRARNLHHAARQVMQFHQGKFPSTYTEILALKGVGNYTAAAIASFAYDLPYAVLDGNVFRVLSRVFGIETPIDSTAGKTQFQQLAQQLLDKQQPARYNQAIMDFGALVCKPQSPLCGQCPFSSECKALEQDKINLLPVKAKKLVKSERYFHYFVLFDAQHIYIQQRHANDIWNGLFEFPMEEATDQWPIDNSHILKKISNQSLPTTYSCSYKQTLSHQYIYGYFYEIRFNKLPIPQTDWLCIPKSAISDYAFPKIVRTYLEDRLIFLS